MAVPAQPAPPKGRLVRTAKSRMATTPTVHPQAAPPETVPVSQEDEVRRLAYFLSLERPEGVADPLRDWLEAERRLCQGGEKAAGSTV